MKKLMILIFLLVSVTAFAQNQKSYDVSSKSINSVTCPEGEYATDIFYSEKSPLKAESRKEKVFFEFMAIKREVMMPYDQTGHVYEYAKDPVTVSLFCNDTEYTLTLRPKELESGVNIVLDPDNTKKLKGMFEGLKYEEQIAEAVKLVLKGDTDDLKMLRRQDASGSGKLDGAYVYFRHTYNINGLLLKELYLYCTEECKVSEESLLLLDFVDVPVAAALLDTRFKGWSRAVVVEVNRR